MPVIAFARECPLPTQPIRAMLRANLPGFAWAFEWSGFRPESAGAADGLEGMADLLRISGISPDGVVAMEVEAHRRPIDGDAPPHIWHAKIQDPVAPPPIAAQLRYLVCYALAGLIEDAHCRLDDDGPWLDAAALHTVVTAALAPSEASDNAQLPIDRPTEPQLGQCMASADRISRLPALILLLDRLPEQIDCNSLARFVRMIDPEGGWTIAATPSAGIAVTGRGVTIRIDIAASACASIRYPLARTRSFWFADDGAAVENHQAHMRIEADVATSDSPWPVIRAAARVMTFLAAQLADLCPTIALYNDAVGTLFGPAHCRDALDVLSRGKLPISLWAWTIPVSLEEGKVSLATLGLEALLGFELETKDAAVDAMQAQQRFAAIAAYLLEHGPAAVKDGDRVGTPGVAGATHCAFGRDSQIDRGRDTAVLALSFDDGQPMPLAGPAYSGQAADTAPAAANLFGDDADSFDFSAFADKAA